jgi:hypothetical protein
MNEDYPSAVKLTNDKANRACGKVGDVERPNLKDGGEGDALDLGGRSDAVEDGKPTSHRKNPAPAKTRIRRTRISKYF